MNSFQDGATVERLSFLIAGAQKCGTTALDAYLRRHPALDMAVSKEIHFFDDEVGVDWRTPDYGRLHAAFGDRLTPGLRGEATPVTLYWSPAHYRILRYNPDMKFIVMVRDPAERAFSHWRMNIARGRDTLDFGEAIRSGRTRVLEDPVHAGLARHSSYVERGFYGRQVAALASLFTMANILCLTQDELLAAPDATLSKVVDFLGVAPFGPVEPLRANVTEGEDAPGLSESDRTYLDGLFAADLARLKELTGIDLVRRGGDE